MDVDFGKQQLDLMLSENYLHPNGQIPAYEWNFGDVNPPVHPWATIFTYRLEKTRTGEGDIEWLERSFQKLLLNFTWWLNRKDRAGKNAFEGGFLGLDNIGVFEGNPHWRDYLQFYEYFHGDNGAGLGASHQTGWTGVIVRAMHLFATTTADQVLELGKGAANVEIEKPAKQQQTRRGQ